MKAHDSVAALWPFGITFPHRHVECDVPSTTYQVTILRRTSTTVSPNVQDHPQHPLLLLVDSLWSLLLPQLLRVSAPCY